MPLVFKRIALKRSLSSSFPPWQDVRCGRPEIWEEEVDPLFRGCDLHHLLWSPECLWHGAGGGRWSGRFGPAGSTLLRCFSLHVDNLKADNKGRRWRKQHRTWIPVQTLTCLLEHEHVLKPRGMREPQPSWLLSSVRGGWSSFSFWVFLSTEPYARKSALVQQYLQSQILCHHIHCTLPQQERSLWGEDQESPPQYLLPRLRW